MSVHFSRSYLLAVVCDVAMSFSVQVICFCVSCFALLWFWRAPCLHKIFFLSTHVCFYAFFPNKKGNFGLAFPKEMSEGSGDQWVLLDEVSHPHVLLIPLRQDGWWVQTNCSHMPSENHCAWLSLCHPLGPLGNGPRTPTKGTSAMINCKEASTLSRGNQPETWTQILARFDVLPLFCWPCSRVMWHSLPWQANKFSFVYHNLLWCLFISF